MSRTLEKRLAKAEAASAVAVRTTLAEQILAARQAPPMPSHTRAELEQLARETGITGQIARGWLRLRFYMPQEGKRAHVPVIDAATVLPQMAGYFYDKPLEFVLFAFDFGESHALRVVRLPEQYQARFDSEFGVEQWAAEFLDEIGAQVRERGFDGTAAVEPIRHAIASGHGISKSCTTALLINFIATTRPNSRGVATANTAHQLQSKTWAELAKWTRRSVFTDWWDVNTGQGSMRLSHKEAPESWNCFGQTAAEERSESFAGLHAADSSAYMVFDEASAIPPKIWEVAEGAMSDGHPFFCAFGNPTRSGTKFFDCFNGQRHRWNTRQIDSRSVQITNKQQIDEWVSDFGEDSDFVRVRVRGIFPSQSSLQFIPRDLVDDAMSRDLPNTQGEAACVAADVARFGDDASVIRTRIGRDARSFEPIRLRGADTMQLASRIAEHVNYLRSLKLRVHLFVDGGGVGGGVVDRLRQLGYSVIEVQFGGKADDARKYANKRAEIWGRCKEWLKVGAIDRNETLATDLTNVDYSFNPRDQIQLERKESMKSRGLSSPDDADALALTFAHPVSIEMIDTRPWAKPGPPSREHDPMAAVHSGHDPFASMHGDH